MLDQQHAAAEALRYLAHKVHHVVAFEIGHPGRRLVQQDKSGVHRQRAGDADPALVGIGQHSRWILSLIGEADPLQDLHRLRVRLAAGEAEAHAGDLHVLAYRHVAEEPASLEGAGHAVAPDPVGREPGDHLAAEQHLASSGDLESGHGVDKRCLASAVGADEAEDLALVQGLVHAVDGGKAFEADSHGARFQRRAVLRFRLGSGVF